MTSRDEILDNDFLQFANQMLLPGGSCSRSDIVQIFRSGIEKKYSAGAAKSINPNYMKVSDLEVELLLFRWNEKYAKAEVDQNGLYTGFHLRQLNPPPQQQQQQQQQRLRQQQQQLLKQQQLQRQRQQLKQQQYQQQKLQMSKLQQQKRQQQQRVVSSKNKRDSETSAENLLRLALDASKSGRISEKVSPTDLKALNFQLEQLALESSLQASSQSLNHHQDEDKDDDDDDDDNNDDDDEDSDEDEEDKKPAAKPITYGDSDEEDRKPAAKSITTARTRITSQKRYSKTRASPRVSVAARSKRRDDDDDDDDDDDGNDGKKYPSVVNELVMNGFKRSKVIHAYELIGDDFDQLLAYLLSTTKTP